MKITLISVGNTQDNYIKEGIVLFENRLKHYIGFETICINARIKKQTEIIQKESEGRLILDALEKVDFPVLLDVSGKQTDSAGFARFIQLGMNKGTRNLAFIIGGPYGFSAEVYSRVPERISLSAMTFSHQLIRLIFIEQLYRAFTIIRGEPYHHE
ncbi:MAG TPA: 23S rRNA (pseudouridine(1915)-N(3))-methyltransferase RlmH [Bacteroidales bacterium]|nr:23S rRNA (pseudouridine(1915)-N(3))-methyltransferase RlmH [Bacteroidales bacterium]